MFALEFSCPECDLKVCLDAMTLRNGVATLSGTCPGCRIRLGYRVDQLVAVLTRDSRASHEPSPVTVH